MEDKINISELICTRISHDLIGNIGADQVMADPGADQP